MKRILASALICAAPLSILIAPPASAQWTVYDPANHIQNIYQAIRSLQEVNQQIQQLTHEIEMLENMARDLEALPDSIADDILRRMRRIEELMREAEGIGYRVEEIGASMKRCTRKTMAPSRRVRPCSSKRPAPAGGNRAQLTGTA